MTDLGTKKGGYAQMKGLRQQAGYIFKRTWILTKQRGIINTFKFIYSRYFYFLKHRINLSKVMTPQELNIQDKYAHNYEPVSHYTFNRMMENTGFCWNESTFIDFGCGKGAAILLATRYNFKRYIGVELSPLLVDECRSNIRKFLGNRVVDCEIVNCNAADYLIGDDVNVFYFFNPFGTSVLKSVLDNIDLSLKKNYRKIIILYCNGVDLQVMLERGYKIVYGEKVDLITRYACGNYTLVNSSSIEI